MKIRQNSLNLAVLILGLITLLTISSRGCPWRSDSRGKIGSSGYEWPGINAPTNLIATAISPYQIDLNWQDNSNNENGFEIERSLYPATGYSLVATAGVNSYSDIGPFSVFTTYYYRVRAYNNIGDRSNYSNVASAFPTPMTWVSVSAGEGHSLALSNGGTIWAWGWNQNGQSVPDSYSITITRPAQIGMDTDWSFIEAGWYNSFAIKTNNTLWSWGANDLGQLGLGDTEEDRYASEQVGTDSDWAQIAGGGNHAIGVRTNGTLWSWGLNRSFQFEYRPCGQLGLGDTIDRWTPSQIGMDSDWLVPIESGSEANLFTIAAGYYHSLAIKTNGTLWAWGLNYVGQLGLMDAGLDTYRTTPTQVGTQSDWASIAAAFNHTIGLKTDSTLWGWGFNGRGQLGLGDSVSRLSPTQIGTKSDWETFSVGGDDNETGFTLALKTDNTIWSWGYNTSGQLGLGDTIERTTPTQIGYPDQSWLSITAGGSHSLGISAVGSLWVWGNNQLYQLGLGISGNMNLPVNLAFSKPLNLIATVISDNQIILSWIDNSSNETGFQIERSFSASTGYSLLTTVGGNVTSYADTGLSPQTTYYYRVKALFGNNDSFYTNVAGAVTIMWKLELNELSPSKRRWHSMIWDGTRVIMFGGEESSYKNDLWWYDPEANTWTEKIPVNSPTTRSMHSMVWDGTRVIMFGGFDGSSYMNDLWWYDPGTNTWTEKTPASSPSGRQGHSMVWDGTKVIMFGGITGTGSSAYKNDVWWYDPALNTWTPQTTTIIGGALQGRYGHSMVWDGTRVIMFGGYNGSSHKNDLWWYDPGSNTWTEKIMQDAVGSPSKRYSHSMVWDGTKVSMFGGFGVSPSSKNDLWWYDPTSGTSGAWLKMIDQGALGSPSARFGISMVWDTAGQRVVMFGGCEYNGAYTYKSDSWWYIPTSNTWIDKTQTNAPSGRYSHSMVWNGTRAIMFGGVNTESKNDLWWYDSTSGTSGAWIKMIDQDAAGSPSSRRGHSMVWDAVRQKVIMFGGIDSFYYDKNDLWWYDPASGTSGAWIKMIDQDAVGSPSSRRGHSMVWDGTKVVMFGGQSGIDTNDLWWYDPASGTSGAWIKMIDQDAAGSPSPRRGHSMVWDGTRVVMFGGFGVSGYMNDLWWYEPISNTWIEKTSLLLPPGRENHSMVWDTVRQKVIMFGGFNAADGGYRNDLWWYDPEINLWMKQSTDTSPLGRYSHSMVWDGTRVIMFGGFDSYSYKGDLWWW